MASIVEIAQGAERGHHCRTCTCHSDDVSPTTGHTPETTQYLDDTIDAMEIELARMRDALVALKRRRNAGLSIARILPELLSEIFLYFRDASIPPTSEHWDTVPWISATHVSAHWRSVALADPRLWHVVNLRFPKLVRHFSDYFAGMPLYVLLSRAARFVPYDADPNLEYGLDYILDHPILALEIYAPEESAAFYALVPYAAETLLSLTIDIDGTYESFDFLEDTPIPNLQSLSLTSLEILPGCALYASCIGSLRELKLSKSNNFEWRAKDIECFICLERLWLSYNSAVFSAGETISLPALTEIHLTDDVDKCLAGLQAFCLPAGCHVHISARLYVGTTGGDTLQEIMTFIAAAHPNHARTYIAEQSIELRYEGAQDTHYVLKLGYYSKGLSGVGMLAAILPHSTTELSVVCDVEASHGKLEELAACTAVQSLSICGPFLVESLLSGGTRKDTTLLPNLSLIRICDCNAAAERELSRAWKFRPELDVRVGRVELCRRTYECIG